MNTVKELAKPATQNGKTLTVQPSTEKPQPITLAPEKPKTLEDTFHRLNVLFDLQKKHAKLQDSKKKLTEFEIAQNKENSTLELSDDEGNEFTTTNPVVIAAVVKLVLQVVNDKSKELEAQIIL